MTTGFSGFKKRMAILSVLCMIITMMPVSTFASEASDIPSHWAKGQIQSWMDNGLIKGYSDGTFRPDNKITRAEFMALVNGAFKYTEKASISYADVSAKAWYADAIAKAKAAGYISGYTDNTMKPNSPITRAEAASIISKIDYLQISGTEIAEFTDATALTWSKDAVIGAAAADIMTGYSDGSFKPQNNIKRGEAVVALDRALSYSKNNTVYSSAGTYGPESGNLAVAGNVTVIEKGTTLKNMTIAGDLIISKNVEDGNITLNNVTVKGQTYIYGGGQNSIIVIDSTLGKVTVSKENGKIRIVVSGNTTVGQVLANSGVKLEEGTLTGNASGFQEITLDASDNDSIILIGSFSEVNVDVEGMNIEIPEGSTIGNLVLDKQAAVTGTGTVTTATINAGGVTFEKAPKASNVASGITAPTVGTGTTPTTPTTTTGGGSGNHSGNSSVAVTAISVTGASNAAIVVNGGTLQMSATVSPATATNQTIVWSVTSGTGIATISSTGLLTGTGVGTVTVKATNEAS
ncbi:MAG: S-layer homology domain-containing protein, partial [Syntrophomonadaceae bacterium]|nr:S-layer homology domain-containing protein [Syntrophomonadaceae bacterium]